MVKRLPVTDHAVLRWIERYGFVDIEAIRAQIYAETREAISAGATRLTIDGMEYRIRDSHVVTLVSKRRPGKKLRWPK